MTEASSWQDMIDERAAQEMSRRGIPTPSPVPAEVRQAEVAADRAIRHLVMTAAAAHMSMEYVAARLSPWVAEAERVAKIDPEKARANAERIFEENRRRFEERRNS